MEVIAILGAHNSGKSEAAKQLVNDHGFQRMSMAWPLKEMLRTMGLTEAQLYGDEKEFPIDLLDGQTPRWAMQSLGTEWGRKLISPNIWVRAMTLCLKQIEEMQLDARIVIDDVRFANELNMIQFFQGETWKIRRPDVEPKIKSWDYVLAWFGLSKALHASERGWRELSTDVVIWNTSTLDQFHASVERALKGELHA